MNSEVMVSDLNESKFKKLLRILGLLIITPIIFIYIFLEHIVVKTLEIGKKVFQKIQISLINLVELYKKTNFKEIPIILKEYIARNIQCFKTQLYEFFVKFVNYIKVKLFESRNSPFVQKIIELLYDYFINIINNQIGIYSAKLKDSLQFLLELVLKFVVISSKYLEKLTEIINELWKNQIINLFYCMHEIYENSLNKISISWRNLKNFMLQYVENLGCSSKNFTNYFIEIIIKIVLISSQCIESFLIKINEFIKDNIINLFYPLIDIYGEILHKISIVYKNFKNILKHLTRIILKIVIISSEYIENKSLIISEFGKDKIMNITYKLIEVYEKIFNIISIIYQMYDKFCLKIKEIVRYTLRTSINLINKIVTLTNKTGNFICDSIFESCKIFFIFIDETIHRLNNIENKLLYHLNCILDRLNKLFQSISQYLNSFTQNSSLVFYVNKTISFFSHSTIIYSELGIKFENFIFSKLQFSLICLDSIIENFSLFEERFLTIQNILDAFLNLLEKKEKEFFFNYDTFYKKKLIEKYLLIKLKVTKMSLIIELNIDKIRNKIEECTFFIILSIKPLDEHCLYLDMKISYLYSSLKNLLKNYYNYLVSKLKSFKLITLIYISSLMKIFKEKYLLFKKVASEFLLKLVVIISKNLFILLLEIFDNFIGIQLFIIDIFRISWRIATKLFRILKKYSYLYIYPILKLTFGFTLYITIILPFIYSKMLFFKIKDHMREIFKIIKVKFIEICKAFIERSVYHKNILIGKLKLLIDYLKEESEFMRNTKMLISSLFQKYKNAISNNFRIIREYITYFTSKIKEFYKLFKSNVLDAYYYIKKAIIDFKEKVILTILGLIKQNILLFKQKVKDIYLTFKSYISASYNSVKKTIIELKEKVILFKSSMKQFASSIYQICLIVLKSSKDYAVNIKNYIINLKIQAKEYIIELKKNTKEFIATTKKFIIDIKNRFRRNNIS